MSLKSQRKDSAYSTTASLSDNKFYQEKKFNKCVVAETLFSLTVTVGNVSHTERRIKRTFVLGFDCPLWENRKKVKDRTN